MTGKRDSGFTWRVSSSFHTVKRSIYFGRMLAIYFPCSWYCEETEGEAICMVLELEDCGLWFWLTEESL